jgi:hypothetical protein
VPPTSWQRNPVVSSHRWPGGYRSDFFRRHWMFLHFEWCRLGMRATTPTQGINGCDGCSVKSVNGFEG